MRGPIGPRTEPSRSVGRRSKRRSCSCYRRPSSCERLLRCMAPASSQSIGWLSQAVNITVVWLSGYGPDAVIPVERNARPRQGGAPLAVVGRQRASAHAAIWSRDRQTAFRLPLGLARKGMAIAVQPSYACGALSSVHRKRRCWAMRSNGYRQEKTGCPAP